MLISRPLMIVSQLSGTPETVQSLPAMTDDSTPAGHASFSSGLFAAQYPAWKAFDQATSGAGWAGTNGGSATYPVYVGRQTPAAIGVGAYGLAMRVPTSTGNNPLSWIFQGSNDGTNYTDLDTRNNVTWAANELKRLTIAVAKRNYYQYHRLYITLCNGNAPEVPELYLYQVK